MRLFSISLVLLSWGSSFGRGFLVWLIRALAAWYLEFSSLMALTRTCSCLVILSMSRFHCFLSKLRFKGFFSLGLIERAFSGELLLYLVFGKGFGGTSSILLDRSGLALGSIYTINGFLDIFQTRFPIIRLQH